MIALFQACWVLLEAVEEYPHLPCRRLAVRHVRAPWLPCTPPSTRPRACCTPRTRPLVTVHTPICPAEDLLYATYSREVVVVLVCVVVNVVAVVMVGHVAVVVVVVGVAN